MVFALEKILVLPMYDVVAAVQPVSGGLADKTNNQVRRTSNRDLSNFSLVLAETFYQFLAGVTLVPGSLHREGSA